jgi:hypothetical protein
LPLPSFRSGHFQINGSDDEGEATSDNHHSLMGLFDIDWDHVSSRTITPDVSNDVGSDVETNTEATTAAQPPTSPQPKGSGFSTAAHFLAYERLTHKLSEEDAKLIWLQFARYESEIAYLRSVISTYEDMCLCGEAGERHPQRIPNARGRSRPLSSNASFCRPQSAHCFKKATLRGETWSRAASSRSCSFNSSAGRGGRRAHLSAAVLLQANPSVAAADSRSIESFLEALPQLGSECTTRQVCEGNDGQCTGRLKVVPMEDLSSMIPLQLAPAA